MWLYQPYIFQCCVKLKEQQRLTVVSANNCWKRLHWYLNWQSTTPNRPSAKNHNGGWTRPLWGRSGATEHLCQRHGVSYGKKKTNHLVNCRKILSNSKAVILSQGHDWGGNKLTAGCISYEPRFQPWMVWSITAISRLVHLGKQWEMSYLLRSLPPWSRPRWSSSFVLLQSQLF